MTSTLVVALLVLLFPGDRQSEVKVLSVCDVLADLLAYRGKTIAVRGEYVGTDEGQYLRGEECAKPLVTSGYVWGKRVSISLEVPTSPEVEDPIVPAPPVSVDAATKKAFQESARDSTLGVWVTVVGRLETRTTFEIVNHGGTLRPYGYGHLSGCPAQLVYTEIRDGEVRRDAWRRFR
jgi:hypothetical protein